MSGEQREARDEAFCRAALLTPAGRGAIAAVAVTGCGAESVVGRQFQSRSGRPLDVFPPSSLIVGFWQGDRGEREEVVVARWDAASIEIHAHGGSAASQAILNGLAAAGAILQDSDAWLAEQPLDEIQREAWRALANVRTERGAGILLDQWHGALRAAVLDIDKLLAAQPPGMAGAVERLDRLLAWSKFGLQLTEPARVVLVGRPNVGKSSLINVLLGYQRSIVFDQPGTTRDLVTASTALGGWAMELTDTAGFRDSADPLEGEGSRRARHELEHADLAVIVVDARECSAERVASLRAAAQSALVVANKIDLYPPEQQVPGDWLCASALTGAGIEALGNAIVTRLVPEAPGPGEPIPFTLRQIQALDQARATTVTGDAAAARTALAQLLE